MKDTKQEKKNNFQLSNVITISIAHFIHDVYSSFLAPILPLLIEKLKLNYTLAGMLPVIQKLPYLFNPLIGLLANNIKIRYLVIIAPAITTICMSLLGSTSHFAVLAILLFIMGISGAMFHVPAPVLIKKVSGNRVGKGMSFYMFGGEAARTIGPLVVLGAVSVWGLEGIYKLIPFGIIASGVLYFKFKNIPISEDLGNKTKNTTKAILQQNLNFFILITGIVFFTGLMKSSIVNFLPTYLKVKGESLWFGGISLSVFEVAGAIGVFIAGSYSDKIGRKKLLSIISLITPVLAILFVFAEGYLVLPLLILLGFLMLSYTPILLAMLMDIKTNQHTFLNSIFMTITFISGSLTSLIIGLLSDYIGIINTFKIAAAISILSIPFVLILARK
ncbi:MAG: MFS transporter [Bacteroidota bacterium]|nr:MFS transporter [Bacteroidota bacterium]